MKRFYINQNNIYKFLIYFSFILFPFQNLALRISSSSYDWTVILLIISIFLFFILDDFQKNFKLKKKIAILSTLIFITYYLISHIINYEAPITRFLASLLWLVGLLNIIILSSSVKINQNLIFKILSILLFFICIHIWIEYFFVIGPENYNSHIKARSMSFFAEPSYAGLILYAAAIGYLFIFTFNIKKKIYLFLFLLNVSSAYITLSLHIVTFIISLSFFIILFLFAIKKNLSFKFNYKIYFYFLMLFSLMGYLLVFHVLNGEYGNHFLSRLKVLDPEKITNVSLLSWFRGMDQAIASLYKSYFVFGTGLGSTGEFEFYSEYGNKLQHVGLANLTLKDSYSLFFRLIIEIGLLAVIIFLVYILLRIMDFYHFICKQNSRKKYRYLIFNFLFGITILIGSLIKEPNFSRSSLYISVFLISSINFNPKKN